MASPPRPVGPVHLADRFAPLDTELIALRLSFQRDGLPAEPDVPIHGYADLVKYLDRLNAEWREPAQWRLYLGASRTPAAGVRMDQDTAWRLFSKGLGPAEALERVTLEGDQALGAGVLGALAVMA